MENNDNDKFKSNLKSSKSPLKENSTKSPKKDIVQLFSSIKQKNQNLQSKNPLIINTNNTKYQILKQQQNKSQNLNKKIEKEKIEMVKEKENVTIVMTSGGNTLGTFKVKQ